MFWEFFFSSPLTFIIVFVSLMTGYSLDRTSEEYRTNKKESKIIGSNIDDVNPYV